MVKLVGPFAYNQAIGDARKLVSEKLTNIEEDLYVLEKRKIKKSRSFYLIDSKNIGKHGKDIENTPFILEYS